MTDASGIAEFLLARIVEDERAARAAGVAYEDAAMCYGRERGSHIDRWSPGRVLAECEAKREVILGLSSEAISDELADPERPGGYWAQGAVYRYLASIYADHPDYCHEWSPPS